MNQAATTDQPTDNAGQTPLVSDQSDMATQQQATSNGEVQGEAQAGQPNLDLIMKIPVTVQVILGTTKMPVAKLMKLGRNAVIPLDRQVGDPIDVVVNGRTVARGEVVLMEDDSSRFGISLTEIVGENASEK